MINDASFTILYGDITKRSDYEEYMGFQLGESARYSLNSKGKNVPIQEIGWGTEDDEVTHMILEFCSSHGGSYIGSPGNTFGWIISGWDIEPIIVETLWYLSPVLIQKPTNEA